MPESAGPLITGPLVHDRRRRRTSTSADAEGVLWAAGGVAGGHSLYVKDRRLRYTFNWVGTHLQDVVADRDLTPGAHVCAAEFVGHGPQRRPDDAGRRRAPSRSTSTTRRSGQREIVTQPGYFCLTGDGICVGRDSASAVTPEYQAPFPFTGGTIDKVVVDVSGERYVDHEAQVRGWFLLD